MRIVQYNVLIMIRMCSLLSCQVEMLGDGCEWFLRVFITAQMQNNTDFGPYRIASCILSYLRYYDNTVTIPIRHDDRAALRRGRKDKSPARRRGRRPGPSDAQDVFFFCFWLHVFGCTFLVARFLRSFFETVKKN